MRLKPWLLALFLGGCGDQAAVTRGDVKRMLNEQAIMHSAVVTPEMQRIAELEQKVRALEGDNAANTKAISNLYDQISRTLKLLNSNADVANENAAKDMTRRGACGTERVAYPDGSWTVRNRTCTVKDLEH